MSDDIFKFSNDNLKKAQDKLAEKEVFEKVATHSRDFSHELVATYVNTKT